MMMMRKMTKKESRNDNIPMVFHLIFKKKINKLAK